MLRISGINDFNGVGEDCTFIVDDIKTSGLLYSDYDFITDPFLDGIILNRPHKKMIYICKSRNLKLFTVVLGIALLRKVDLELYTNEEFFWRGILLNHRFNHKLIHACRAQF